MKQFLVNERDSGRRLDQYITKILPNAGISFIYKMLRKKNITVNKKRVEGNYHLCAGDSIEIFFSDETFIKMSGENEKVISFNASEYKNAFRNLNGINIIYEDDDFIFIDKPIGILSQKSDNNSLSVNEWLIGYLLDKGEITEDSLKTIKPAFCNRLDRNTTGLMLGGKSLGGLQILSKLLHDRTVHKYYSTTVEGHPDHKFPVCADKMWDDNAFLIKDSKTNKVLVFDSYKSANNELNKKNNIKAKVEEISTGFRLVEEYDKSMKLEVLLYTGKSHQIRAHLSYLGHPIIGDSKYGNGNRSFQELRAYRIVFPEVLDYPAISCKEFKC